MLAAPIRRPGAAALDGSLSLELEVCGPEPPNESIAADHYRAWYPVRASVRTRRTLSTFLECIRIAVKRSLEASEGDTMQDMLRRNVKQKVCKRV